MKLAYLELCGFRGYRNHLRIDFAEAFTVLDGRNGVGKSTVFDAIEFALTGTISKYGDISADGETVQDYIWWSGDGPPPADHYVEVGFRDDGDLLSVRRTQMSDADPVALDSVLSRLCDTSTMPQAPLPQLCAASLIRDEYIATLSLDLKESARYALLRDAIGATDADAWIERGAKLVGLAKRRTQMAEEEVKSATGAVTTAARRIDEIRASLVEEELVAAAAQRLQAFTGSTAPLDQIAEFARPAIADRSLRLEALNGVLQLWTSADAARSNLATVRDAFTSAVKAHAEAEAYLVRITDETRSELGSEALTRQARDLAALVALGRRLGLRDGQCPLCSGVQSEGSYTDGIEVAEIYARQLDSRAVEQVEQEHTREAARNAVVVSKSTVARCRSDLAATEGIIQDFARRLDAANLAADSTFIAVREHGEAILAQLDTAREDLRIVETLKKNTALERAVRDERKAKDVYLSAEKRLGVVRRAEGRAQALHDAARRAAGESLNGRLERVSPLTAELYRRLRPHPIWGNIEYKIRGDVRRFLTFQVGDEVNPQFIFSSGQRRATGLAFLLSVNLSLAWSRWRTILLDDPVQHVDDFRSIQLAEVMAQLAASGRQIICAVEDAALADLLCRRLPVQGVAQGKRITLGPDADGALAKLVEQDLNPLVHGTLVASAERIAV